MRRLARILMGDLEPQRKVRDLLVLAGPWLLADLGTKLLALGWLAGHPLQILGGGVRLELSINESLFAFGQGPSQFGLTPAMVVGAAIVQAMFAGMGFVFGRAKWTLGRKLVLMGLVVVVAPGLGLLLGSLVSGEPNRLVVHAARAFGSLTVLLLAFRVTRSRYLGMALSLWIAGNLGNAINVLYYPRGIIDFLYVPRLRHYIGIFNLADVALELSKGLILLSPLALILFRPLARRNPAWERRLEYLNPPPPSSGTVPHPDGPLSHQPQTLDPRKSLP